MTDLVTDAPGYAGVEIFWLDDAALDQFDRLAQAAVEHAVPRAKPARPS